MSLLGVGLFLLATSGVLGSSLLLSHLARVERPEVYWLSTGVVYIALVYVYVMGLGVVARSLSAVTLTAISLTVLLGVGYYARTNDALDDVIDRLRAQSRSLFATIQQSRLLQILFVLLVVEVVWLVFLAYLLPPLDWDSLVYHLPPVIEWIQAGEISTIGYVPNSFFPKIVELYYLWNIIFIRSNTFVNFTQLYFGMLGFVAVYTIAAQIGLNRTNGLIASFVFFFTPVVLLQSIAAYVDLAFGVLVLTSIAFLVLYWNDTRRTYAVLFGISTGLLLGSKSTGVLFVPFLSTGFVVAVFKTRRRIALNRRTVATLTGVFALVVVFGGYWYARNWVVYGNPVYPVAVSPFGIELFPGRAGIDTVRQGFKGSLARELYSFQERSTVEVFYLAWYEKLQIYTKASMSGWGPQWAVLALPSILLAIYKSVDERDARFGYVILLFLLPFLFQVAPWYPRYNLYLVGLGAVSVGYVRQHICINSRRLLSVVLVLVLLFSLFTASAHNPWKYDKYVDRSVSNFDNRTPMTVRPSFSPLQHKAYTTHIPSGSNIGFTIIYRNVSARDFTYNLYDENFRNEITYVGGQRNASSFGRHITEQGITHLLLRKSSRETEWANESGVAVVVYQNNRYLLYEVENDR